MQLLARLMDRVLAARGERVTIVGATSGDTGGAAIEAFRGSERVDAIILFPQGRISDVQRRMMTTAHGAQRARGRHRGHLRRLPGAGEGHVQRPGLPRPGAAGRRQLHQLGAHRRPDRLLLRRRPLRSAARTDPCRSRCRPATSATSSPATRARRMGLPIERLAIATNDNDILAPRACAPASTTLRDVVATTSPSMDIQVSSNFERYLFEACRARCRLGARQDGRAAPKSGRFGLGEATGAACARDFQPPSADRGRGGRLHPPREARERLSARSAQRLRRGCRAQDAHAQPRDIPRIVLATAHPGEVPRRHAGHHRRAAGAAAAACLADVAIQSASPCLPNDLAAVQRFVASRAAQQARSRRMSIAS